MIKLGIIVFANDSGLGAQTRRLTYMLKPDRILAIDSSGFSKNKVQHFDWYDGFSGYKVSGFPTNHEIKVFIKGLTHVLVCENPLNFYLLTEAKRTGVKVYIQSNYEFCDHLDKNIELPEQFLMPSYWHVDTMKQLFGESKVQHLAPPIDPNEFVNARNLNFARNERIKRFVHIVGTLATHDRNGTLDLLSALRYSKQDFQLIIRSQHDLPSEYVTNDKRVTYRVSNEADAESMYRDFDALILPRRYGGLSLTTNEALMSGLPVIMTNISPNNQLLPKDWLVKSVKKEIFYTRTEITTYSADHKHLGQKLDWLTQQNFDTMKTQAFNIGYENFSPTILKPKYEALWSQ